jgi:hypothetical protein
MFEDMSEGLRRAVVSMCCAVALLIENFHQKNDWAWTYHVIMLMLDLFHIALAAEPR